MNSQPTTSLSEKGSAASELNDAPPYEQIKRQVDGIIYTPKRPNGPAVGRDGIEDQEFLQELSIYRLTLVGKQANNWTGWYIGHTEPLPDGTFGADVLMREPKPNEDPILHDIQGYGMTSEQIREIEHFHRGQRIVFSGTIDQINSGGQLELSDFTARLEGQP